MENVVKFSDRLIGAIKVKGNPVCVGIDPILEMIPKFLFEEERGLKVWESEIEVLVAGVKRFCEVIIDEICDLVPVVKFQSAYFECLGYRGWKIMEELVDYAKSKGLLVILDAKRGDIGSTAQAYSLALIGESERIDGSRIGVEADAVTVSPYLGVDGVKPFLVDAKKFGKGVFVLVKTSNWSSADLQDLKIESGEAVYEIMGHLVESWGADEVGENGYSDVCAVVGATFPEQAKKLREIMRGVIFLVPGYGAQGGTAEDVRDCFDEKGLGAIINSSRAILFAYKDVGVDEKLFGKAARGVVQKMILDLKKVLEE